MDLVPTPSQTVGPFFHTGLTARGSVGTIASPKTPGERVVLTCRLLDGDGAPVDDGVIEVWQADAAGKYRQPEDASQGPAGADFPGFGRMPTGVDGSCVFETIRPGRVPGRGGTLQAPHINVIVLARGLLRQLSTRVYFAGDEANEGDPVLALVPEDLRGRLMAVPDPGMPGHWRFDIHLSGALETVFFDI